MAATDQGTRATPRDEGALDQSVTFQVNPTHSGLQTGSSLIPPLVEKWRLTFFGPLSYPVIADGRIFVIEAKRSVYGTRLWALDAATGVVLWHHSVEDTYYWGAAAYENGRLFVLGHDGLMVALDPATGDQLWSIQLGLASFSSAPTAVGGVVYTSGSGAGGNVYAIDQSDGTLLWITGVLGGDSSSPAILGDALFVSYACPNVYRLDRITGAIVWHYNPGCSGGGGRNAVYNRGRVWVREPGDPRGFQFDARDGRPINRYDVGPPPAFDGDLGFFVTEYGGPLVARELSTESRLWTSNEDGGFGTAPVVANGVVYAGSTGNTLFALDEGTGAVLWSVDVGSRMFPPDEHNVSQPLSGLGVGGGLLVVPATNVLVAYGN